MSTPHGPRASGATRTTRDVRAPGAPRTPGAARASAPRFPVPVDDALRAAGWQPGRWDMLQAEHRADTLRGHTTPSGHRHTVLPAAVEVWAEFGGLPISPTGPGRQIAPTGLVVDPLTGLYAARTLSDLGRALGTGICPLGTDGDCGALLAMDAEGHVYSLDHTGDWYLGHDFDAALGTLITGVRPQRLAPADTAEEEAETNTAEANTAETSTATRNTAEVAPGATPAGPAGPSGSLPGPRRPE